MKNTLSSGRLGVQFIVGTISSIEDASLEPLLSYPYFGKSWNSWELPLLLCYEFTALRQLGNWQLVPYLCKKTTRPLRLHPTGGQGG